MTHHDFLPTTDHGMLQFSANFSRLINLAPASYGLPPATASQYEAEQKAYALAYQAAIEPETRGKRTVSDKQAARKALEALTRQIARQVNNTISVTNAQREALGLTVRSGHHRRTPIPAVAPTITVKSVVGRAVKIELKQENGRRAKPAGAASATVFTHVGPERPATLDGWQFNTVATRAKIELRFAPGATGETAWVTAFWVNARGDVGPASQPVRVDLPAAGVVPVGRPAAQPAAPQPLRIAA